MRERALLKFTTPSSIWCDKGCLNFHDCEAPEVGMYRVVLTGTPHKRSESDGGVDHKNQWLEGKL